MIENRRKSGQFYSAGGTIANVFVVAIKAFGTTPLVLDRNALI